MTKIPPTEDGEKELLRATLQPQLRASESDPRVDEPRLNNGVNLRVILGAYAWDYNTETGEVLGLTAGDHGYEETGIVIETLTPAWKAAHPNWVKLHAPVMSDYHGTPPLSEASGPAQSAAPSCSSSDPLAQVREEDSDAVVVARIDLLDYLREHGLLFPGMDERNHRPHQLIDAFALAVRAEAQQEIDRLKTEIAAAREECPTVRRQDYFDAPLIALVRSEVSRGFMLDSVVNGLRERAEAAEARIAALEQERTQ